MADNFSQIADTLADLNTSFEINTSDILNTAISSGDANTGGWLGIIIFFMMSASVLFVVIAKSNIFGVFDKMAQILIVLNIIIDIGFYLYKFEILTSLQIIVWFFTLYFVLGMFSLIKKDSLSGEV